MKLARDARLHGESHTASWKRVEHGLIRVEAKGLVHQKGECGDAAVARCEFQEEPSVRVDDIPIWNVREEGAGKDEPRLRVPQCFPYLGPIPFLAGFVVTGIVADDSGRSVID